MCWFCIGTSQNVNFGYGDRYLLFYSDRDDIWNRLGSNMNREKFGVWVNFDTWVWLGQTGNFTQDKNTLVSEVWSVDAYKLQGPLFVESH
ncbi:hypothetical protein L1887_16976 [Cichorium endivia]|nr:hypothetical protein L1887_16976 [Cichorium endivia]